MNQQGFTPLQHQPNQPNQPSLPNQRTQFDFCCTNLQNAQYVPQQMDTTPPRSNDFEHLGTRFDHPTPMFMPQQQIPQINQPMHSNIPSCYIGSSPYSVQQSYCPLQHLMQSAPLYNFLKQDGPPYNGSASSGPVFPGPNQVMQPVNGPIFQPIQPPYDYYQKNSQDHDSSSNPEKHICCQSDNMVCIKRDCPASISLQALASQFLAIQGVISCVATRIILKRIPGSNIYNSDEEIMAKAQQTVDNLSKKQLLSESRTFQQLNSLINLHMTMKPPISVLPILTLIQLKINSLKARVDSLISRKIMENQGHGAEAKEPFSEQSLSSKGDEELRELMACLKQKELNERMNLTVASHHLQRSIVEDHLNNIKYKIQQIEDEFNRRRNWGASDPVTPVCPQRLNSRTFETSNDIEFEPMEPFLFQIRNPKKLNLQPHVGCPETTYQSSSGQWPNDEPANEKKNQTDDDSKRIAKFVVLIEEENIKTIPEMKDEEVKIEKQEDVPPKDDTEDEPLVQKIKMENEELVVVGKNINYCED